VCERDGDVCSAVPCSSRLCKSQSLKLTDAADHQ